MKGTRIILNKRRTYGWKKKRNKNETGNVTCIPKEERGNQQTKKMKKGRNEGPAKKTNGLHEILHTGILFSNRFRFNPSSILCYPRAWRSKNKTQDWLGRRIPSHNGRGPSLPLPQFCDSHSLFYTFPSSLIFIITDSLSFSGSENFWELKKHFLRDCFPLNV